MTEDELIDALREALDPILGADTYSLDPDIEGALEVVTDDWSLVFKAWPKGIAFVAGDEEPETNDPEQLRAYLRDLIGPALPPLTAINAATAGAIGDALTRSRDPLSIALASLVAQRFG